MSGTLMESRPRHPENKKLSEMLSEDVERKKVRKGLIDKKATLIKAPDDTTDGDDLEIGSTMRPSDEQLGRINQFTRRPVTADEVICFTTLSCNDIVDRDDDRFTSDCVKDFAALEQPFSPVGKSYMVDHSRSISGAVGRIFGVDTKKVSGGLFLANEVYIPNTDQYRGFIEDVDFGINWAVSVGVVLGKDACTVCEGPFSWWGYWCVNGHDKGMWYDPKSDETDSWGYPTPVEEGTSGAVKCIREFSDPIDFYELSQVFLGAQYFAALEKEPGFASVMKSVAKGVPTIGLSAEEAEKLPLRHEPKKVSEARMRFGVTETEDGSLTWTDEANLIWVFNPEDPESGVMSLGRAASDNEEDESGEEQEQLDEHDEGNESEGDDDENVSVSDPKPGSGGSGSESNSSPEGGEQSPGSQPGEVSEISEEKALTKKQILAAARAAKLPGSVIDAAEAAEGDGLKALLLAASQHIGTLQKEVGDLSEKAEAGDRYIKEVRTDAISWYVKAHQEGGSPVKTDTFERLLDRCGEDVDLLKSLRDEQKAAAQAKAPKSVRRSSFPSDPNQRNAVEQAPDYEGLAENDERVRKIHG